MKKISMLLLALVGCVLASAAQEATYKIIAEADTTVKTRVGSVTIYSRPVRRYIYEYTSKDADGKPATISGVIMIPSEIASGEATCDGIMLFNRATLGSPDDAPSTGNSQLLNGLIANPLKPNYILVMSDFIGYGSSIDYPSFYLSGDVNARNSLDGLLAAKQLLDDKNISQGKYLFNLGFSQGGSESLYVAKLRDMEYKDKGITFTKTFAGGGPTDYATAYREYVKKDWCEDCKDVIMMIISCVENCHMDIDYKDLFKEPLASGAKEYVKTKSKSTLSDYGVSMEDSLHNLIQPAYMDPETEQAQAFIAKLEEINLMNGWEPDTSQKYFIEHSRHDNYVPIQCVRAIIPWMTEKGFTPSLVPGKTNLQTNTMVFKLDHTFSAIVWLIQTVAAIEVWPVLYYEGEQNHYYHDVVKDMNLMKVIKTLESLGINIRQMVNDNSRELKTVIEDGIADGTYDPNGSLRQLRNVKGAPFRYSVFDLIPGAADLFAKVGLTTDDVMEMLDDSGISLLDLLEVYAYVMTSDSRLQKDTDALAPLEENIEAPLFLMRYYERQLADWFLLAGYDVHFSNWGM
ncbi:MAG: hypothetical protein J6W19_11330 [Prevotella sp.]|nr:hypothetical protein [Prevotella sp.]